MKMESILGSKLAMVTGWGAGFAILFTVFGSGLSLAEDALRVMDALLALSVSIFTILGSSAIFVGVADLSKSSSRLSLDEPSGKVMGGLIAMALLLCGWFVLDAAPEVQGAVRTATALGISMASVGAVVIYVAVIRLVKQKEIRGN